VGHGFKEFIVSVPDWTPDTMKLLTDAAGSEGTVNPVPRGQIAISIQDRWLSEVELATYLKNAGISPAQTTAGGMFDAFMHFNERAAKFRVEASEELQEQINRERQQAGTGLDFPLVALRLIVDPSRRLVAASSVEALSRDIVALICWFNNRIIVGYLRDWVSSFTTVEA
jgi:hypothetical protein